MSLINKMLQDLDARGTPASQSFLSNVMPVAPERRSPSLRLAGLGAGAALAVAACSSLAWFGWHHWHAARPGSSVVVPPVAKPATAQGLKGTIVPAPAAMNAPPAKVAPPGAVEPQASAPASVSVPAGASAAAKPVPGPAPAAAALTASVTAPLPAPVAAPPEPAPAPRAAHKRHADDE